MSERAVLGSIFSRIKVTVDKPELPPIGSIHSPMEVIYGKRLRKGKLYWIDVRVKMFGKPLGHVRLFDGEFKWLSDPPKNIYIEKWKTKRAIKIWDSI